MNRYAKTCAICSRFGIVTPATLEWYGTPLCDSCAREYESYLLPGEHLEDVPPEEMERRIYSGS